MFMNVSRRVADTLHKSEKASTNSSHLGISVGRSSVLQRRSLEKKQLRGMASLCGFRPLRLRSLAGAALIAVGCVLFGWLMVIFVIHRPAGDDTFDSAAPRKLYSIVFDAGSTGTRMHLFQFRKRKDDAFNETGGSSNSSDISLFKETYFEVTPGLSQFADRPSEAAESLRPLLEKALTLVPESMHAQTPLTLKATAGLRLLPEVSQQQLLDEVRDTFRSFPFRSNYKSVEVMDGNREGIYAWLMVAFVLDYGSQQDSIVTFDLGGGSTQIALVPDSTRTLSEAENLRKILVPWSNNSNQLYTRSYLGGGLMYGRSEIFKKSSGQKAHIAEPSTRSPDFSNAPRELKNIVVESPCIHPDVERLSGGAVWQYFEYNFTVVSSSDGTFGFRECYKLAQSYVVDDLQVFVPEEIQMPRNKLYLFSYYNIRAVDCGLISSNESSKTLIVGDYKDRAVQECGRPPHDLKRNAFLCVDLTYIYALLHDGFRLSDTANITVATTLRGITVSWALGAALAGFDQ